MKAVIFSDCFFAPEVFEKAVSPLPFWSQVERVYFDVGWPRVPFSFGHRLREYVPYPKEALEAVQDATILVTQMGLVDEVLLGHAPLLRVVGCLRSGPVNVDQEALARRGIPLLSVPERSVEAVAEFTLGLCLAARRKILQACREAREGSWTQALYFTYERAPLALSDTVVGLIGFGRIGRRVAELFAALRVARILACDPYVGADVTRWYGVEKVTLEDLLKVSDVVSLHVRYTDENRKMIGEREFLLMKPGSIFVNTSRGDLVDEEALIRALQRGIPAFACIDTLSCEPWRGKHPLADFENVLLTPHIAGASRSTVEYGAKELALAIAMCFEKNALKKWNGVRREGSGILYRP